MRAGGGSLRMQIRLCFCIVLLFCMCISFSERLHVHPPFASDDWKSESDFHNTIRRLKKQQLHPIVTVSPSRPIVIDYLPIIAIMSEVLPYKDNINYGDNGDEEQISLTCRLQNTTNNFFGSTPTKRAPKLGQIGRSKRVVIEDDRIDEVLNNTAEKSSAGV